MTDWEMWAIRIVGMLAGFWIVAKVSQWLIQHMLISGLIAAGLVALSFEMLQMAFTPSHYNRTLPGELFKAAYFIFWVWGYAILQQLGFALWKSRHRPKPPRGAV